jgi:hypothetical protein
MAYTPTSESATVASTKNPRGIHPLNSAFELESDFVLAVTYVCLEVGLIGSVPL